MLPEQNVIQARNGFSFEIYSVLPRLLSLLDGDKTSPSYGLGDRYYWAWGLIDFGNGTYQGLANGLSRLWTSGLWPYETSREIFLQRIDSLFHGAKSLTRKDGSLEEAFPNEGSYCVTALVAYDLLVAIDLLADEVVDGKISEWMEIVSSMICYLIRADESHGLISNHLATAVAALVRWDQKVGGDLASEKKSKLLLDRILGNQSAEGWFREYEGADPGYQSLCTYYLADVHQVRQDWNLLEPLRRSLKFLSYFAHPDGSFGGLYGSRCTRFYYPAGISALASEIPEAKALSKFMDKSIAKKRVVTLSSMDEPNLVPMFNCYCWGAALTRDQQKEESEDDLVPAQVKTSLRKWFPEAGLLVDRGSNHYTVISTHKGGVVCHFAEGSSQLVDCGLIVKNTKGKLGSTQGYSINNESRLEGDELQIRSQVTAMPKQLPKPFQFLILRILSLTAFRFLRFREWVKQRLVRMLITKCVNWPVTNTRQIKLGYDLTIEDQLQSHHGYEQQLEIKQFVPIHMASQGYWQFQDEEAAP